MLRLEGADHIDLEFGLPTIDAVLILLVGAGCVPISRFRDGATIGAHAVKLVDWRDGLDQRGNDRDFVTSCYARIRSRLSNYFGS